MSAGLHVSSKTEQRQILSLEQNILTEQVRLRDNRKDAALQERGSDNSLNVRYQHALVAKEAKHILAPVSKRIARDLSLCLAFVRPRWEYCV